VPAPSTPITLRSRALAAAHLPALARRQARQRHGQRGEVVHHHQGLERQALAHLLDGESPVVVGHAHRIAFHRVGDGDGRVLDRGGLPGLEAAEVGAHRGMKVGMIRAAKHGSMFEPARRRLQREAGVGAADVGKQSRAGDRRHGASGAVGPGADCAAAGSGTGVATILARAVASLQGEP
jgi:hypothetical protein